MREELEHQLDINHPLKTNLIERSYFENDYKKVINRWQNI